MSVVDEPTLRQERIVMYSVALVLVAGIALGFIRPPRTIAIDYISTLVSSVGCGALCFVGIRRGGRTARWTSVLMMAMFVLDIAKDPHVPEISALCLGTSVAAFVATLRNHQRFALVWTVACSVLWGATLVGGLLLC